MGRAGHDYIGLNSGVSMAPCLHAPMPAMGTRGHGAMVHISLSVGHVTLTPISALFLLWHGPVIAFVVVTLQPSLIVKGRSCLMSETHPNSLLIA